MTLTVEVGEAKARLRELVARVEAGEEVVIARGREGGGAARSPAPRAPRSSRP